MEKKIRTVIIEDESLARALLIKYLDSFPGIEICGEYADGYSAIIAVNEEKPQLLFLDIKLPKISGVELVELLDYQPEIIFTTAHDEYALKAFEMNAVDYLLKPFSKERFVSAVERAVQRIDMGAVPADNAGLAHALDVYEQLNRIVVKNKNQINVIAVGDIYYFEAQDDYVMIYTADKRYLKQATLKSFEARLDARSFVRVHRSYLVSTDKISRLEQYEKDSYNITMENKKLVPVSRSGYKTLKAALGF